jgi:predicted membrane protein
MAYSVSQRTRAIAFISVLAALHIVLSIPPGPVGFRRPSIVLEPLEGMIGGPVLGFAAATIGWIGGRAVRPESFYIENFFGFAESMGALGAGLLTKKRWWVVAIIYGGMLIGFVVSPFARQIPLWTLWDTYLGFIALFPAARLVAKTDFKLPRAKSLLLPLALITFVAVELDAMTRLFMLADLGLYQLYGLPAGAWYTIFIAGAFQTPIEAVFSVLVASAVGGPVLTALRTSKILDWPIS